jgi:hypothetical protein
MGRGTEANEGFKDLQTTITTAMEQAQQLITAKNYTEAAGLLETAKKTYDTHIIKYEGLARDSKAIARSGSFVGRPTVGETVRSSQTELKTLYARLNSLIDEVKTKQIEQFRLDTEKRATEAEKKAAEAEQKAAEAERKAAVAEQTKSAAAKQAEEALARADAADKAKLAAEKSAIAAGKQAEEALARAAAADVKLAAEQRTKEALHQPKEAEAALRRATAPAADTAELEESAPSVPVISADEIREALKQIGDIQKKLATSGKNAELVEQITAHLESFKAHIETQIDKESNSALINAITDTITLLNNLNPSKEDLEQYKAKACTMQGHARPALQLLGKIMLALSVAMGALVVIAFTGVAIPAAALLPTSIGSAALLITGGYSLFAGRQHGIAKDMHQLAQEHESLCYQTPS